MKRFLCPDYASVSTLTLSDSSSCLKAVWNKAAPVKKRYDLSRLEFICEEPSKGTADFMVSDDACPVVSERLMQSFNSLHIENIDYYPAAVIKRKGGSPESGFYAANILGLVDCVDTDKTECNATIIDGVVKGISLVEKLVLKDAEVFHGDIYRVHMLRRMIMIEDKLISFFTENSVPGAKLVNPEKWDGIYGEVE